MRTDRQADMKLTVAFCNFANAPMKLSRTCHEGTDGEQRYTSTQFQPRCYTQANDQRINPGTHCTRSWVGPRADLVILEKTKFPLTEI
jgi:hypothetical protein